MSSHPLPPGMPIHRTIRRIAVVRALYLGDLLLAVPALRALRAGFPRAEITLVGLPWAEAFVRRYARVLDRFVPFAGYPGIAEVEVAPDRMSTFLTEQRAYEYGLVVQMHGSGRASTPLALALGGRFTVGYYEGERPAGLTLGAPYPDDLPEVLRNLELMRLLDCTDLSPHLEFPLLPEDHAEAAALLRDLPADGRPLIGIHAGSRSPARRWPAERFARAAVALARRTGARFALTGGPGDEATACAVAQRMRAARIPHADILDVAGKTSLGGLAALIARMDLLVSNDTGPAHLAEAVSTPTVRIFGPTDPRRWAPLDGTRHVVVREPVACSPCGHWECPIDSRCLERIDPLRVIAAAERLLAQEAGTCSA